LEDCSANGTIINGATKLRKGEVRLIEGWKRGVEEEA
jgi:hypothetical protein